MNGILGWIVAAIVVVVGGYYVWTQTAEAPVADTSMTGQEEQTSATTQENTANQMSGTWQSTTDAKFTREIRADGVMIDRYEGDVGAGVGGEWSVVDPAQEAMLLDRAAALSGMTVIKVVWEGGVETTYFAINSVSGNSLTTTDLTGRGAVTIYTKVTMTP